MRPPPNPGADPGLLSSRVESIRLLRVWRTIIRSRPGIRCATPDAGPALERAA